MNVDKSLKSRLEAAFAPLNTQAAAKTFPAPATLSRQLEEHIPEKGTTDVEVPNEIATLFVTAAVDMWRRSVHSFLTSASLTEASPIWSSVSGYYSSHYSIRAFAHLLGYFHLFRGKCVVRIQLQNGKHICSFDPKDARSREHQLYWKVVKKDSHFNSDPLFTVNESHVDVSDVAHRDRANYSDHLGTCPKFLALDSETLKSQIQFISQIDFTTPPIPDRRKFPDTDSVQVVAYHRIVKFRSILDEVFGGKNRFWNVHRNPTFGDGMIDYQLTKQSGLEALRN